MATLYVGSNTLYLAGSGVIIGATSATLTTFTDIYANVLTMADFGSLGYITFEPDTTNEEFGTFTGVTANANGTYTLTGLKTALAKSPYTQTSGLVRTHSGGTKVVVSDSPAFWDTFVNKENTSVVTGYITMPNGANRPVLLADTDTATANAIVTFGQLSRQAISGASNASTTVKGIVELATQAETDARTTAGSTGALLVPTPDTQRSTKLSDAVQDTGTQNTHVLTLVPAATTYATGLMVSFVSASTNTGASTINTSGLGAKSLLKGAGLTALAAGDVATSMIVVAEYNGTAFQMINSSALALNSNGDGSSLTGISLGFLTSGAPATVVANTTTTVLTYALAGGTLGTNKGVRIRLSTSTGNTAVNGTYTVNVKYGGTTISTYGYSGVSGTPSFTSVFVADILLMGSGATGTQRATGIITQSGTSFAAFGIPTQGTSAIDSTASQNITVELVSSSTSVSATFSDYFIQKII